MPRCVGTGEHVLNHNVSGKYDLGKLSEMFESGIKKTMSKVIEVVSYAKFIVTGIMAAQCLRRIRRYR